MRRLAIALLICVGMTAGLVSTVDAEPRITHYVDEETLPFDAVEGFEDSERQWGIHQRAGYRYEVPADWNGELVMWAHGFRGTENRLYFNEEEVPMRRWLLEHGYAWAASTYSHNNYVVGEAVTDTHQLARFFENQVEHAERVYIAGASMGGHITAVSVERYPGFYDGGMPVCGVVGDFELFDYFLDFNAAAQQIGLGESQFPASPTYLFDEVQQIKGNLEAGPGGWPLVLNDDGESFKQLVELRSGGDRPNFDEAWGFWNSSDFLFSLGIGDGTVGTDTRVAVDNSDVFYETDLIPGLSNDLEESLNENIVRVEFERGARRYTRHAASPPVRGDLEVPVLTMHNLGDLFVPFHNEVVYYHDVASQGRSDLLVQRAIRGSAHCGFSTAEYEHGFSDLVNWVENGVRPEGDDVGDPAAVADPDFGCRFTDPSPGAHVAAAPCDS